MITNLLLVGVSTGSGNDSDPCPSSSCSKLLSSILAPFSLVSLASLLSLSEDFFLAKAYISRAVLTEPVETKEIIRPTTSKALALDNLRRYAKWAIAKLQRSYPNAYILDDSEHVFCIFDSLVYKYLSSGYFSSTGLSCIIIHSGPTSFCSLTHFLQ